MKIANLVLFAVVMLVAMFMSWLIFQQFPWVYIFSDMLEGTDDVIRALKIFEFFQHVFVYLLAAGVAMAVLRFGENHIFSRQAKIGWGVILPLGVIPVFCLGSPIAYNSDSWFSFLLFSSWCLVFLMGVYSLFYQSSRALSGKTAVSQ